MPCAASCHTFGFVNAGLTLFPKVCNKANISRPIFVPVMYNQTDVALCKLCFCRALKEYVRCTSDFRHDGTAQLFVTYGGQIKGKAISKQRFSKWLVECIKFAYDQKNLPTPMGLRDTRHAKWQSNLLTCLVLALRPFDRLHAGQIPVHLQSSIGSTPSPTQTLNSAGEFQH